MAQARNAATLTPDQMRTGIQRLKKALTELRGFDPSRVANQYDVPQIPRLSAAIDEALVRTFGANTLDYQRYRRATDLGRRMTVGPPLPIEQVRAELVRVHARSIGLLQQAISGLESELGEFAVTPEEAPSRTTSVSPAKSAPELLTLKPTFWGVGIDLKEMARRIRVWWKAR